MSFKLKPEVEQMSFLQGGVSLKRFQVLGPVPDHLELVQALAKDCFRPFEDGSDEERIGWSDWRNLLITPPDPDWLMQERYALFGLRIDTRKIPSALLKAHIDLKIQTLMKEKDLAFLGKEARTSLQDEVKAELLRKVLPTPKVVEVAWDLKGGLLLTTAGSGKTQSALLGLFQKTFGCELQHLVPLPLAMKVAPEIPNEVLLALNPISFEQEVSA
jgi:DNA recombination-dependent growth factor C